MTLLRAWLIGSGLLLAGLAVWAFAPVLVFMGLVAAALGFLSLLMIRLSHALRDWWDRRNQERG
jgi:hypothetical protein